MKETLCVSFSGGRTSAFMAQWCLKNLSDKLDIVIIYANTGKERPETLDFIKKCDDYFGFNLVLVEAVVNPITGKGNTAKVVTYETLCKNGEPFEAVIQKFGLPNQNNASCSRDLKRTPIESYFKKQLGIKKFKMAIGIRADEPRRINWEAAKKNNIIYPLVTMVRTTKSDINKYWSSMPFDLELKSYEGNCDMCWKKSFRKLMTIATEHPELADWWKDMEVQYENKMGDARLINPNVKIPIRMYRNNMSIDDIKEEAKFPFDMSIDESKIIDNQLSLWDAHMDTSDGCTESCEPF